MVERSIGGGAVGYLPRHQLIFIEGRLAALCARDASATGLISPEALDYMPYICALEVSQLLHPYSIFFETPSLRRLDLACDLRFADPAAGLRFTKALGALDLPGVKSDAWRKDGRVETVYFRTPTRAKVRLRVYDRGVLTGDAPAGERLRIEAQYRWGGSKRPDPADIARSDLGRMWQGPLRAWAPADSIVVAGLTAMENMLLMQADEGNLSCFAAERLLGTLRQRARGYGKDWWARQGRPHIWGATLPRTTGPRARIGRGRAGPRRCRGTAPLGLILRAAREAWPRTPDP